MAPPKRVFFLLAIVTSFFYWQLSPLRVPAGAEGDTHRKLLEVFKSNSGHDNQMDAAELGKAMGALTNAGMFEAHPSSGQLDFMMKEFDRQNDTLIDYSEFKEAVDHHRTWGEILLDGISIGAIVTGIVAGVGVIVVIGSPIFLCILLAIHIGLAAGYRDAKWYWCNILWPLLAYLVGNIISAILLFALLYFAVCVLPGLLYTTLKSVGLNNRDMMGIAVAAVIIPFGALIGHSMLSAMKKQEEAQTERTAEESIPETTSPTKDKCTERSEQKEKAAVVNSFPAAPSTGLQSEQKEKAAVGNSSPAAPSTASPFWLSWVPCGV